MISGHHNASGDPAQDAELAKQRAMAVRDALKTAGVAEDRIELKKPEQLNAGDAAAPRRVESRSSKPHRPSGRHRPVRAKRGRAIVVSGPSCRRRASLRKPAPFACAVVDIS